MCCPPVLRPTGHWNCPGCRLRTGCWSVWGSGWVTEEDPREEISCRYSCVLFAFSFARRALIRWNHRTMSITQCLISKLTTSVCSRYLHFIYQTAVSQKSHRLTWTSPLKRTIYGQPNQHSVKRITSTSTNMNTPLLNLKNTFWVIVSITIARTPYSLWVQNEHECRK
jgi:hypothetical protein